MSDFPSPITALEFLLEKAKAGEIISIITLIEFPNNNVGSSISSVRHLKETEVYGLIERVRLDIYHQHREIEKMRAIQKQLDSLKEENAKEDSKVH